ncbi:MAG TPA: hypothetical protein DIT07_00050 [Sphingobacteriaceae bacterium]|nr:hypothetical protein [Sphingobacteriaceae bacterium]
MVVKLLLNILINIGIFILLLCFIWAFNHAEYSILGIAVIILALLVYLKFRMIKNIRELTKKR